MNPLTFIVSGVVSGSVYGLAAMGVVLNYKVARVVNFAFGAIAMFCAYCYWQLRIGWGLPLPLALFGAVVVVPSVLALATESLVYRRLTDSSVFARTAASIGLLIGFYGICLYLWNEPIVLGQLQFPDLYPDVRLDLPGVTVNGQQIGVVVSVAVLTLAVYGLLRFTRIGVQLRAVVVNRGLSELRGVNALRVTQAGWIVSYIVAGAAGVMVAPLTGGDPLTMTLIVIYSLAGAALGGFLSLPLALVGGLALGLTNALMLAYLPVGQAYDNLRAAVPFVFLSVVLIVRAKTLSAVHDSGAKASILNDLGPMAERRRPALGKLTRSAAAVLVIGVLLQAAGSTHSILVLSTGVGIAMILLSYRVFTATTGMVSLAQGAFAGLGAFTAANLVSSANWPWLLAVAGGAVVAAAASVVIALPTVRLRGVFLALATLAFAQFVDQVVFSRTDFTGGVFGKRLPRPEFLDSTFSYFLFMVAAFWVVAYGCERFQYSVRGIELQADLASGPAARSIGIRPEVGRLLSFVLAAATAAVGGSIMASQIETVSVSTWGVIPALMWLTLVASGGVGSSSMMLQMGIVAALVPELISVHFPEYVGASVAIFGILALALLRVPGGLAAMQHSQIVALREAFSRRRRSGATRQDAVVSSS
jgi:branched-subunit amino acid ABC-type transport system permease component